MKVSKIKEILESDFSDSDEIKDIRELYTASNMTPTLKANINSFAIKAVLTDDLEALFASAAANPASKQDLITDFKDTFLYKIVGELYGADGQTWLTAKG